MGSHFVRVYSVDDVRIRSALGSGDRNTLIDWLQAILKDARYLSEIEIQAREEAAEQLVSGDIQPGERSDGHYFVNAFLALCAAWADRHAVIEC